jgi:hypothetical protein
MAKFRLVDLTVAQVEAIEVRSEVSFDQWTSPKASKAAVFGSILVELGGVPPEKVAEMPILELVGQVKELLDLGGG